MADMNPKQLTFEEFQEAVRRLGATQTMKQLLKEFEKIRVLELERKKSIKRFVKILRVTGCDYLVVATEIIRLSETDARAKALITWIGDFEGDLWEC